ncbi:DNA-binding NarL/FixJ family response regulator [Microlunatus parietis]|uniref:DNA-binding NarL/FixJ family response regulator n=2 Tax=Microlunatus parietis TaxID=682979 RepID=A0A7Y9IDV7_9ACTN|nr:DNA-binding NarL/FixJ family response regulator [Microlunatus parietis]
MIALFAEGLCLDTIARRLNMSDRTVRRRARDVCDRLGAGSMIQVVAWAARHRFI